jgi:hypothetical protein
MPRAGKQRRKRRSFRCGDSARSDRDWNHPAFHRAAVPDPVSNRSNRNRRVTHRSVRRAARAQSLVRPAAGWMLLASYEPGNRWPWRRDRNCPDHPPAPAPSIPGTLRLARPDACGRDASGHAHRVRAGHGLPGNCHAHRGHFHHGQTRADRRRTNRNENEVSRRAARALPAKAPHAHGEPPPTDWRSAPGSRR